MKKILLFFMCLLILSCESFVFVQRNDDPPAHAKAYGHRKFYYYPDAEIYYNPAEGYWVIYQDDKWVKVKEQPKEIISINAYIEISDDSGEPWSNHSSYKNKHPKGHSKKNKKS